MDGLGNEARIRRRFSAPCSSEYSRGQVDEVWWCSVIRFQRVREAGSIIIAQPCKQIPSSTMLACSHENRKDQHPCHARLVSRKQQKLEKAVQEPVVCYNEKSIYWWQNPVKEI